MTLRLRESGVSLPRCATLGIGDVDDCRFDRGEFDNDERRVLFACVDPDGSAEL